MLEGKSERKRLYLVGEDEHRSSPLSSGKVQHHEGRRALCVLVKTQCTRLWTHDHWSSTRVVWARGSETQSCGVFEQIMFWSDWRAETKGLEILSTGSLFAVFAPCTTSKNTINETLRHFENSRCAWLQSHTTQRRSHSDTIKLRQSHSPLIAHRRRRPSGTVIPREHWLVTVNEESWVGWQRKPWSLWWHHSASSTLQPHTTWEYNPGHTGRVACEWSTGEQWSGLVGFLRCSEGHFLVCLIY